MKIWEVSLKETESCSDTVFENLIVLANDFDEAVAKVRKYLKDEYSDLKLEILSCEFLHNINIE